MQDAGLAAVEPGYGESGEAFALIIFQASGELHFNEAANFHQGSLSLEF